MSERKAYLRIDGGEEIEFLLLLTGGQFTVIKQVADLDEIRVLGQLLDGIATVKQYPLVAVDEGNF